VYFHSSHFLLSALFSFLFCLNIVFGNASINSASVAMSQVCIPHFSFSNFYSLHTVCFQVIKSSIPAFTLAFSIILLHKVYTNAHYFGVFLVIIGLATATYGGIPLSSDYTKINSDHLINLISLNDVIKPCHSFPLLLN
jgi:drug/metabolite transporter (DMT)-like permease